MFFVCLIFGSLKLGISVNLLLWCQTYRKFSLVSGMKFLISKTISFSIYLRCFSATISLIAFPVDLQQMLYMNATYSLHQSQMMLLKDLSIPNIVSTFNNDFFLSLQHLYILYRRLNPSLYLFHFEKLSTHLQITNVSWVILMYLMFDLCHGIFRKTKRVSNITKTEFLYLSTQHLFSHNYNIFFENTKLKPSFIINILDVSCSLDLS